MPKPFDATTKFLLEFDPLSWVRYVGLRSETRATAIDADLSTLTAEADKVIRIEGARPWLLHIELQASYEDDLPIRLARYNVLLEYRHRVPVWSVVILLRPEADGQAISGRLQRSLPTGVCYDDFRYHVVRAWEQPVESVLAGGLATLPLAPIADVQVDQLAEIVRRMQARLAQEATGVLAGSLWTASYLLMGLRYPPNLITRVLQGVRGMKESTTYQAILAEGEAKGQAEGLAKGQAKGQAEGLLREARKILMRSGTKRFGAPDAASKSKIESLLDVNQLEDLIDRVNSTGTWQELLSGM